MASKYRVSASFDLVTEIEPEGLGQQIDREVSDIYGAEDIEASSYFGAQSVTCDGGQFALTIEADDEHEAEMKVRNVLDDGHEFEDYNGFTWVVESVSFETEQIEWEPTVEEAVEVLMDFVNSHTDESTKEGRVAKAAAVVLGDHAYLGRRVSTMETNIAGLTEQVRLLSARLAQVETASAPTEPTEQV
jgi:hypothetical protein